MQRVVMMRSMLLKNGLLSRVTWFRLSAKALLLLTSSSMSWETLKHYTKLQSVTVLTSDTETAHFSEEAHKEAENHAITKKK